VIEATVLHRSCQVRMGVCPIRLLLRHRSRAAPPRTALTAPERGAYLQGRLGLSVVVASVAVLAGAASASATVGGHFFLAPPTRVPAPPRRRQQRHDLMFVYGSTFVPQRQIPAHHTSNATFTPTYDSSATGSDRTATPRMDDWHYGLISVGSGKGHRTFRCACLPGDKAEFEMGSGLLELGAQTPIAAHLHEPDRRHRHGVPRDSRGHPRRMPRSLPTPWHKHDDSPDRPAR